jgi:hypothetical protein
MIVRVSGEGQYELDEGTLVELDRLDTRLTEALNGGDAAAFQSTLEETIRLVEERGTPVPDSRVVPSEVIIPPRDTSLEEARQYFTDEGLMEPLPA